MLETGKTRQEIVDLYVAKYGERILAKPRAQWFKLTAYVLPWLFLILGGWSKSSPFCSSINR